jgi:hypothetical protein
MPRTPVLAKCAESLFEHGILNSLGCGKNLLGWSWWRSQASNLPILRTNSDHIDPYCGLRSVNRFSKFQG